MKRAERLILLSNDDGIDAPGLEVARRAVAHMGRVVIVAPSQERSASSHSLTIHQPVRVEKVGPDRFSTTGTPVDCVVLALRKVLERPPDLVVSGINRGANLGEDVLYSGTVAAAREGAMNGIAAIAVSFLGGRHPDFETAGIVLKALVGDLAEHTHGGTFFNVNIPEGGSADYRFTRQGSRRVAGQIEEKTDPRGRTYYWIGPDASEWTCAPETDYEAVTQGFTSVTPLQMNQTDFRMLSRLQREGIEPQSGSGTKEDSWK